MDYRHLGQSGLKGLGQIVFSPIAQGVLTGKYLPGAPPPAASGPRVRP